MQAWGQMALALAIAGAVGAWGAPAGAAGCQRADFEAVVNEAAASLREMNSRNKPAFQEKLRELKVRRGWSQEQFLAGAAPFVRDGQISVYDKQSERLLDTIATLGQEGSSAAVPDCRLLDDLKAHMRVLVEMQVAKWTYMFKKIDAELGAKAD